MITRSDSLIFLLTRSAAKPNNYPFFHCLNFYNLFSWIIWIFVTWIVTNFCMILGDIANYRQSSKKNIWKTTWAKNLKFLSEEWISIQELIFYYRSFHNSFWTNRFEFSPSILHLQMCKCLRCFYDYIFQKIINPFIFFWRVDIMLLILIHKFLNFLIGRAFVTFGWFWSLTKNWILYSIRKVRADFS